MRLKVRFRKKEVAATALMCLLGLAVVLQVSASSVARISGLGAGVLPVLAGAALMAVGILWLFESRLSPDEDEDTDIGNSKWRGVSGLASGLFAFLVLSKYGGVLVATFAFIYISVLGDSRHSWRTASALASGLTLAAGLLLAWSPLGLNVPMVRWG